MKTDINQGGFIPDIVLWLSYFYTSRELPIRLSYFWTTLSSTSIITSLMAFGLLRMRGINGWAGWQWMFLVEGLITLSIGLASFFMMPASAVQTKTWFRPNGWFTDREVTIVVNRVLRDDPSKGDMHNREAITPKRLWETLKDYDLWPLYAIGLVAYIPHTPPSYYLTLTLRKLGFSAFNTNLLVIPSVSYPLYSLETCRESEVLTENTVGRPHNHPPPPHSPLRPSSRTHLRRHAPIHLDPPLHSGLEILAGFNRRRMGYLHPHVCATVIPLLPRHFGGVDIQKRQQRRRPHRVRGGVQHVCPNRERDCEFHLPGL